MTCECMKSQLWHDASEEPDKSGSLVLFDNGALVLVREYTSYEEIKSEYNFSKWAYYDSFVITYKITFTDTELLLKEE